VHFSTDKYLVLVRRAIIVNSVKLHYKHPMTQQTNFKVRKTKSQHFRARTFLYAKLQIELQTLQRN